MSLNKNTVPLLQVKDLVTKFRTDHGHVIAVNHVSYNLHEKEILGIVGESGSGKTVSCMSIMRLYEGNANVEISGGVFLRKQNILELSKKEMHTIRGAKIAMIFQNPMTCLNPFLTIGEQLLETVLLHTSMKKKDAFDYSVEMLQKVHIPDPLRRMKQYPHHFSGGMRQRVMIAIALSCRPDVLIADEPTTALDVTVQAQILDLIEELIDIFNTAVIFITHDMGVVARLCQNVCVMYAGKVVEKSSVEDIFHRPLHPYTKGLLQSIPRITNEKQNKLYSIRGNPPNLTSLPHGCSFAPRCEYATQRCHEQKPRGVATQTSSNHNMVRMYRCFHPLNGGNKVEDSES